MIEDLYGKPWALRPAALAEIEGLLGNREAIEVLRQERSALAAEREKRGGVAVVPVLGVLEKRGSWITRLFGGTPLANVKEQLKLALAAKEVSGIVLLVDSPGGSVDGTKDLADFILENRGKKPIVAFADGMMASAAYWIGSAAGEVVAEDTALVGSIGVALTHVDRSERDSKSGIRRTQIFAGRYKRIASDEKPLTKEGAEYLQGLVDTYYGLFLDSVAAHRGVSVEHALSMADGREFIGRQALEIGLVDRIGTFETALQVARGEAPRRPTRRKERVMNFMELVSAHQERTGCSRTEALKATVREFPGEHQAFLEGRT